MSDYDLINGEILTVTVTVDEETVIANINTAARGPAGTGGGGTNSVTSATTSDGTAALYLDSIRFEATNGGPTQLGEMAWESTDGSIDAMLESGVIVAMGEDLVIRVRNTTASPITKGTALAYDGTSGASGRIEVKPWVGANIPTAKLFLGFAACDMPANSNGYSQWFGKLAQINTSGGAQTWIDQQIIYAVPGASATLTNVAPTSGEYAAAAVVINAGNGTSGILFVRPTLEVASSTSATANTLVLRDGSGGASLSTVTLSGTGGSPFTSTLTGGVNFANRTLVLPDVSGTLVTAGTLANSATITASAAVVVDTIVLRDGAGQINITNSNVTGATAYASTAAWTYAGSSASAHRIALGAGTTGSELFGAATEKAAREAIGTELRTRAVIADADFYNTADLGGMSFQTFNSGAATQSTSTSTADHPGVLRMASGAATNSGARLRHDGSAMVLGGSESCEWVFQIQSLSNGVGAYIGFHDSATQATPTNGVWVQFDGNGTTLTCSGKTNAGSTPTTTATTYSAAINTWYSLTVEMNTNATLATFTLRSEAGSVLWTDTLSSNIPTGPSQRCSLGFVAFNVNNSVVALSLIDYARMEINRTLTR